MHRLIINTFLRKCKHLVLLQNFFGYYLFILFLVLPSCLPFNSFLYIIPDQKDLDRFKHKEVAHASTCFEFNNDTALYSFYVSNWSNDKALCSLPLNDFLKRHKAIHFIVLKNDTILHEYTNPKITNDRLLSSFSLAKPMISTSIGLAIEQGYIVSVNDLVKKYIPELN